jgi:hypothetical protein
MLEQQHFRAGHPQPVHQDDRIFNHK